MASLRTLYGREKTLFDHQQVACTALGFRWMSEHQRRSLVRELRDEVARIIPEPGIVPEHPFRLGYAPPPMPTPRRLLEQVIT